MFYGMGMIAFIVNQKFPTKKTPCHKVLDKEFLKKSNISILKFSEEAALLEGIKFKTLEKKLLAKFNGDYLWILSTPIWSGCMQKLHESTVKDPIKEDHVVPLPLINLNPIILSRILFMLALINLKPIILSSILFMLVFNLGIVVSNYFGGRILEQCKFNNNWVQQSFNRWTD